MDNKIIINPIINITDPDEEAVIGIVHHLSPILDDWRAGEDLRNDLIDANQAEKNLNDEVSELDRKLGSLKKACWSIQQAKKTKITIGVVLLVITIIAKIFVDSGVINLGFLGCIVFLILGFNELSNEKNIKLKIAKITDDSNDAISRLNTTTERINAIQKELLTRVDTFPEITQIRCAFPATVKKLFDDYILLDNSGVHPKQRLETIDTSAVETDLNSIKHKIEAIADVPVLLAPVSKKDDQLPIDALYGEEEAIQDLVGNFIGALNEINDVVINLPIISSKSKIAHYYNLNYSGVEYKAENIKIISNNDSENSNIIEFTKLVNDLRKSGTDILSEINDSFQSLEQLCHRYSEARINSLNEVHKNLYDVLNKASWCSKRFYCPRTIQSPVYIEDLLSISINKAHLLNFETLINNLKSDHVVNERIKENYQLINELNGHYHAIHDSCGPYGFDDDGRLIEDETLPAFMVDQCQESIARFKKLLRNIMTGSQDETLVFSSQSQMFYDPESNEWVSDVIPYRYSSAEILKYGQMLKINTDLMIPLWEHLWTEKSDFIKSELFRTNESILRMTEKESEKLIEVGNQFRSDMRMVRENINLIESDLKAKNDELISFRDGMDSLGLLSNRQKEFLTDEKLRAISLGDNSVIKEAEDSETILAIEPKAQAERRGSVSSPVDYIKSTELLITYQGDTVKRLLP